MLGTAFTMGAATNFVFNPTYQIGQGDGSGERIGRKIQNAYMLLGFEANMIADAVAPGGADSQTAYLRLLVIRSRAIKFGTVSTVFTANPGGMTPGDVFYFQNNPVTSQVDQNRWTVLMDRMYKVTQQVPKDIAGVPSGPVILKRNIRIPLPKVCTYRDDTVGNSVLSQAETYVLFVCDFYTSTSILDPAFNITPTATIRFTDA